MGHPIDFSMSQRPICDAHGAAGLTRLPPLLPSATSTVSLQYAYTEPLAGFLCTE